LQTTFRDGHKFMQDDPKHVSGTNKSEKVVPRVIQADGQGTSY